VVPVRGSPVGPKRIRGYEATCRRESQNKKVKTPEDRA
jgi:hypothetical protein